MSRHANSEHRQESASGVRHSTGAGLLLVISGPSGVGKTTIAHRVQSLLGGVFSISATTRPKSDQETEGRDYYFVTDRQFTEMVARGEFLEHAEVFGRYAYGTPARPVEEYLAAGRLVVLDIDVQGGVQIRRNRPDAFMIFVLPPSDEELLRRLRSRGRDEEEAVQRRFAEAKREIELARASGAYDAFVVNEILENAIEETLDLVRRRWSGGPSASGD